jgi:formate/nitrite transporter FocA (FNT family)
MAKHATARKSRDPGTPKGISEREVREVEELATPRTPVIYEVVRRLGDEEMNRPATSLWWSGVAAGLSISFSLLGQAMLEAHLPDAAWRPLVSSFGYCVGFLIVVLGRQQLFTESTITVVLPVLSDFSWGAVWRMIRLGGIVLAADLQQHMLTISRGMAHIGWLDMAFRGVASGFLIAAMVWMIPSAEAAKFWVITLMTYLIALGNFTHIVAGSMEAYLLVLAGDWQWWQMVVQFFVPVLIGNVIGGTALFALIAYAQVMEEI